MKENFELRDYLVGIFLGVKACCQGEKRILFKAWLFRKKQRIIFLNQFLFRIHYSKVCFLAVSETIKLNSMAIQ